MNGSEKPKNDTTGTETDEMVNAVESLEDIKDEATGDVALEEFDKVGELPVAETQTGDTERPEGEDSVVKGDLGWDKERQRADQAEANFRKTQQEKITLESKLETTGERIKELEKQLAELTKTEEVNLNEIDESITDPNVIKAIRSLQSQLKIQEARAQKLEQAKAEIETRMKADRDQINQEQSRSQIISSIETKLHKRLGVENPVRFRNDAIEMANEICADRGYSPGDRYEAAEMLEDCYIEIINAAKSANQKGNSRSSIPTDTGKGSGSAPVSSEQNKPCSLKQAVKELRKNVGL